MEVILLPIPLIEMAPPGDSKTFFKAEAGRGQNSSKEIEILVEKANQSGTEKIGVKGILLGPPGAGKGTQVGFSFYQN